MKEFKVPSIVEKLNKDKGRTVITTLTEAKALRLKRMFSGSFNIDDMIGGGYAYKRIQLLFGSESSGKNAQLNQMIAYNQRLCRVCHGIRPDIPSDASADRWTVVLRDILKTPVCKCADSVFTPKRFQFIDFEKTLSIEEPRIVVVKRYIDKENGTEIDGLDYSDRELALEGLKNKKKQNDKDQTQIAEIEQWLQNIKTEEHAVEHASMPDYLKKCGVIVEELLVSDPADTEEGIEYVRELVQSLEVDGIIWDSLQAAVPKYVKGREADEATMGTEAKQNALLMRLASSAFSAYDLKDEKYSYMPALFIISQVRASLGFIQKAPSYSGGFAVKHFVSLALEAMRKHYLREDGTKSPFDGSFYGQKIRWRTEKTKLSAPSSMREFDYYFKDGANFKTGEIDHCGEIVELGVEKGLIEKAGTWYKTKGEKFQGMEELKKFFRDTPVFVGDLYQDIRNR
jgi:RecA/RadA recombinase